MSVQPQSMIVSLFDNAFVTGGQSYKYYNEFMWKGRYAEYISVEETIGRSYYCRV